MLTSRAKLLITDRRNRLRADIIEASECFNSWRRAGLLPGTPGVQFPGTEEENDSGEETGLESME